MYLGAPVWVFDKNEPFENSIKKVAAAGAKGVELIIWNEESIETHYQDEDIRRYRDLISDLGLILSEFVVPARTSVSEDPSVRKHAVELFKRGTEIGAKLGTKNINFTAPFPFNIPVPSLTTLPTASVFTMGDIDMNRDWEGNYNILVEAISTFCDITQEYGLNTLVEPHPHRWIDDMDSFRLLHRIVNKPNLKINYDTNHTFVCGDLVQYAPYRLRDLIGHVHCSDNDGLFNAHWRPGKGKIDWPAFIKALADIHYDGAVSFEIGGLSSLEGRHKDLSESIKYFEELCLECGIQLEK